MTNVWKYKPWWCQPWSILLTGILVISGSWQVTKNMWITGVISMQIIVWWTYFLIIWPKLIKEKLAEK